MRHRGNKLEFCDARGMPLDRGQLEPGCEQPFEHTLERHNSWGLRIDPHVMQTWGGETMDYDIALAGLLNA